MAHNGLILGRSQYGKTSAAIGLCRRLIKSGRRALVYDILWDDWDEGLTEEEARRLIVTDDQEEFLKIFWGSTDLVVFVEEAAETAGKSARDMVFTATRGRHQIGEQAHGHSVYYSCHRLNQLDVTMRDQCPELFLFACGLSDARDLADHYGRVELKAAPSLEPGEFYHVAPGRKVGKYRVDFETKAVVPLD
jgi:hypothetical protein